MKDRYLRAKTQNTWQSMQRRRAKDDARGGETAEKLKLEPFLRFVYLTFVQTRHGKVPLRDTLGKRRQKALSIRTGYDSEWLMNCNPFGQGAGISYVPLLFFRKIKDHSPTLPWSLGGPTGLRVAASGVAHFDDQSSVLQAKSSRMVIYFEFIVL